MSMCVKERERAGVGGGGGGREGGRERERERERESLQQKHIAYSNKRLLMDLGFFIFLCLSCSLLFCLFVFVLLFLW